MNDLFIPDGRDCTFVEMAAHEKSAVSMRRIAREQPRAFLPGVQPECVNCSE